MSALRDKPTNLPIFVPHAGCLNRCIFCNQHVISGAAQAPSPESVTELLCDAQKHLGPRTSRTEIAFFGGSFTAVDPQYRLALLKAAAPFCGPGGFAGIRVSTRPDCIDRDILRQLSNHGVTSVELGVQSMDDAVLRRNLRGHTAADVRRASRLIRELGFLLGHQMMVGLAGDTSEGALCTARELAGLRPDTMRIYPVLALPGTELARLYESGEYTPLTLPQAVEQCADLLEFFTEQGIRVIRLGLHDSPALDDAVAGPRHPAFRELCESRILLRRALAQLKDLPPGPVTLRVNRAQLSSMAGQKRANRLALAALGYSAAIRGDSSLGYLQVAVDAAMPEGGKDS